MAFHRKLKVGVTGGIGSGKTTVCKIFESLGIPVYYADDRAKWLMIHDADLKKAIQAVLGEKAYEASGKLNRSYLAERVFNDAEQLNKLNRLVHPAVGRDAEAWHDRQEDVPYTIKEAALIYESGSFRQLDRVITVTAPESLRIRRVRQRDGVSRAQVLARMANQLPEAEKVSRADFVIYNDGERSLLRQVWDIHRVLRALASEIKTRKNEI